MNAPAGYSFPSFGHTPPGQGMPFGCCGGIGASTVVKARHRLIANTCSIRSLQLGIQGAGEVVGWAEGGGEIVGWAHRHGVHAGRVAYSSYPGLDCHPLRGIDGRGDLPLKSPVIHNTSRCAVSFMQLRQGWEPWHETCD